MSSDERAHTLDGGADVDPIATGTGGGTSPRPAAELAREQLRKMRAKMDGPPGSMGPEQLRDDLLGRIAGDGVLEQLVRLEVGQVVEETVQRVVDARVRAGSLPVKDAQKTVTDVEVLDLMTASDDFQIRTLTGNGGRGVRITFRSYREDKEWNVYMDKRLIRELLPALADAAL